MHKKTLGSLKSSLRDTVGLFQSKRRMLLSVVKQPAEQADFLHILGKQKRERGERKALFAREGKEAKK